MTLPARERYRFGFVLSTTIGNLTRYVNLRKYAERDPEVEFTWVPVTHYVKRGTGLGRLVPRPLHMRYAVLRQAAPGLSALRRLDAVMLHLYEAELLTLLWRSGRQWPRIVSSTDEAPIGDPSTYPMYPADLAKSAARLRMRLAIDRWRAARVDMLMPFSQWAADLFMAHCGVEPSKVRPMHVGLDLEQWQPKEATPTDTGRPFRILFVGADFERKGGPLLVDVFMRHFSERAELHLVSNQAPDPGHPRVFMHRNLSPNDPALTELYRAADVCVVPTTADLVPWVYLEAMAVGTPVIGTTVGAIPELIPHGKAGFVIPPRDGAALRQALETMIADAGLRHRMAENGRRHIETSFNAAVNVPIILSAMKDLVDRGRRP